MAHLTRLIIHKQENNYNWRLFQHLPTWFSSFTGLKCLRNHKGIKDRFKDRRQKTFTQL